MNLGCELSFDEFTQLLSLFKDTRLRKMKAFMLLHKLRRYTVESRSRNEHRDRREVEPEQVTVDWKSLNGGEIYDRFVMKGAKLGIQANKVIRLLKSKGFLHEGDGKVLAKKKQDQQAQRSKFLNLSREGLELLRMEMFNFANPMVSDEGLEHLNIYDVPKNLRARVWHLASDPRAVGYLEFIFGGVNKQARRAQLDDKTSRAINNWQILCDDFFNSPSWCPENEFEDSRLVDIDPSMPPAEPFAPEKLRKLFSKMRSDYSTFHDRYHRSGQLVEGDDDFFEKFSGSDAVYLYAHLMFKGLPPKFCTRNTNQQSDTGVCSTSTCSTLSSLSSTSGSDRKRKFADLTKDDYISSMKEEKRDKEIASYFLLAGLKNAISGPLFSELNPSLQEALKAKYAAQLEAAYLK
jgi:hypothetical protein